ncbi:FKBP-type peptidyl-prolyl cis-trans isomerase [Pseudarthrobacter sp. P1]|uniref:FKBP-type peptidyl-prolyl cis-trans isomerase n=1 Tax=Pseudarthrobacter sp. P1 TaxID=3418418 RepID=UPI003CF7DBE0
MRRILAIVLPALLLLTACSTGSSSDASSSASLPATHAETFNSVKVKDEGEGKAPTVTFDKPLAIEAESIKVLNEGKGDVVKAGQSVVLRQIGFNAVDGTTLGENFTAAAGQTVVFDDTFKTSYPLVYGSFVGAKVGSLIGYATPGAPATPAATPSPSATPTDGSTAAPTAGSTTAPSQAAEPGMLSVFLIQSATDAPKLLSKDETDKLDKDGKLPAVAFDDKGIPSITIPSTDAPKDLVVKVLSEGSGDVLTESDSINALYTGWQWSNSTKFDSSYDKGTPLEFKLTGVIEGWTKGLTGQKVGSKLLMVIPSSLGYGDDASKGGPTGTLVFVVDIVSKK